MAVAGGSDWLGGPQGRALAAEIKRMKLEVAEKAKAYAMLQAERAAEREEIISLRRQLEDAREEVSPPVLKLRRLKP